MGFRNVKIEGSRKLRIENQQLVIEGGADIRIPLEDINSILIENQMVMVSAYMLQKFADLGIALYVCNEKHLPNGVLLPIAKHSRHYKLLKCQIEIKKPLQKRLWQQIVVQKVRNQSLCLKLSGREGEDGLQKMCKEIQSGDKTHVEAKAAAFYFRHLFGSEFSRNDEHIVNGALNYGYAIVRGIIARSIVCYGLEPSIGLFHRSELNSYNLADDFIEPFRPVVDLFVASKFDMSQESVALTPELKRGLYGIVNFEMKIKGEKRILSNCIDGMVASYSSVLQGKCDILSLPELIPLQVHSYE